MCHQTTLAKKRKMIQLMTHGVLHVAYHSGPQTKKEDTNYDACSVCHPTTLAKRKKMIQIMMHGVLNAAYHSGLQTKKEGLI